MAYVAIILVQINIQFPKIQILFTNDISVIVYKNSHLVLLCPTPKIGQPVSDGVIFDIQFLQIAIRRTSYLSQILALLRGMEDNRRMKFPIQPPEQNEGGYNISLDADKRLSSFSDK